VKLSLNVLPPPRQEVAPAASVRLSEPMLRFRCNQKGCCCSGWDIPFRLEDFLRLHDRLTADERGTLTKGIQLVVENGAKEGEQILHSLKLDGVGEDRACRFLSASGGCGVQARHGIDALPDLCVDFPAFGYRRGEHVELFFDPVCPEVLERLDESDEPLRMHEQGTAFGDAGFDLRVQHATDPLGGRIGAYAVDAEALERIRALGVAAFAVARPPWLTLAALAHAFRRLRTGNEAAFEVVEPEDPQPFLRFLSDCIGAHGADLLAATATRYRRFIHAVDPAPLLVGGRLVEALGSWGPAYERWLAPQEEALRPLTARWLAHRFATPMLKRGELRESADGIVHLYATSLRLAAAFGEVLERRVDRPLYKVAIGTAEFLYRSLHLPRDALPSFAAAG
jgi:Fe-S-cluster containining protein